MRNPHGTPVWYELLTVDRVAATGFYEGVVGWTVGPKPGDGAMDYRMILTEGVPVAGMMERPAEMAGAETGWLFYVAVDDVDAALAKVVELGGRVEMGPFDMAGVGRMALIADPQGQRLYVMRFEGEEPSRSWTPDGPGSCNWNELVSPDPDAARDFYAALFGWTYPERMVLPDGIGDYWFVEAAGQTIGAVMGQGDGQPAGWGFYFRVADLERSAAEVAARGGSVIDGPMPVPGGDRIIVARDPEGETFGAVASGGSGA